MVFDHEMRRVSVCLPVTNPAGTQSLLYGQRFSDGPITRATPAIVLVHGIASSTENWDFAPTWSVARALASAGYVVFSYDRLGYARSHYNVPGGGFQLTTQAHRAMLHDVVGDVKTGGYRIASGAGCGGTTTPGNTRNAKVVIVGHSAGGWIVAGYPGEYHDVAAMIQNDISGSTGGSAQPPVGHSKGGGFTPDANDPSYFKFFQTSQDCYEFNTYAPGLVGYAAKIACRPPFLNSPFGEILDIGAMYAENDAYISMIGRKIPVLLSSGAQDTTDPPATANADYRYYKAHCGCRVRQITLAKTAHLFMVHKSLAQWVNFVVGWLARHGLAAPAPTFTG
jgi:pimeloyl-ACP methyl ester carboxylesterase